MRDSSRERERVRSRNEALHPTGCLRSQPVTSSADTEPQQSLRRVDDGHALELLEHK